MMLAGEAAGEGNGVREMELLIETASPISTQKTGKQDLIPSQTP